MRHLPRIDIRAIPHKNQEYDTCGDYRKRGSLWIFRISKTNFKYEGLILIHEMTEWFLNTIDGISNKGIDRFDMGYEKQRRNGIAFCGCLIGKYSEPGDDIHAPYYKNHQFATMIEKQIARKIGVQWAKYDKEISLL